MCARAARLVLLALCAQGVYALNCKQGQMIKSQRQTEGHTSQGDLYGSKQACVPCPAGQTSDGGQSTTCYACAQGCYEKDNLCHSFCGTAEAGGATIHAPFLEGRPTKCYTSTELNTMNANACAANTQFNYWSPNDVQKWGKCDNSGVNSVEYTIMKSFEPTSLWYTQSLAETEIGVLDQCYAACAYSLQQHMQPCQSDFAGHVVVQPLMNGYYETVMNGDHICRSCTDIHDTRCLGVRYQIWSTPSWLAGKHNVLNSQVCSGRTIECSENLHAISAPVCYWVENAVCYSAMQITLMAGNTAGKNIDHVEGHREPIIVRIAHLNRVEQIVTINYFEGNTCSGPVLSTSQGNFIPQFSTTKRARYGSFNIILNPGLGLACSTCPRRQGAVERLSGGVVRCQACAAGSHVPQSIYRNTGDDGCGRSAHE